MKIYKSEVEAIGIEALKIWTRIYKVTGYARVKKGKRYVADHKHMAITRLNDDGKPYVVKIPLPIHEWRQIFEPTKNLMLCVTKPVKTHNEDSHSKQKQQKKEG